MVFAAIRTPEHNPYEKQVGGTQAQIRCPRYLDLPFILSSFLLSAFLKIDSSYPLREILYLEMYFTSQAAGYAG